MQLPDLRRPLPPLSEIEQFEAVRLFVERAQTVQPEFTLNQHNAEYVVDICRKLDGNPLALELAAARTQVLSPAQIAALLKDRFQLLTSGGATASSRQRTLRAVVDWSYESLQPTERDLFNRLSVFVGGFTLEAAAALCDDGSALIPLLNGLTSLAEFSLIYIEGDADGAARYLIPETLRQYALARLSESGQTEEMRRRHATYFLSLVERANEHIATSKQGVWIDRLERESDNLRTALHWSFDVGDTETALRLGGALWRYWLALGHVVFAQGHHVWAAQLAVRIYDLVTTIDDQRGLAAYLELSSLVAMECGKPGHAIRLFAASTSLREQIGYTLEERDQARSESCLQSLRALLPQEQFAAEWELGSTMKSADAALEAQQVLDSIKGP